MPRESSTHFVTSLFYGDTRRESQRCSIEQIPNARGRFKSLRRSVRFLKSSEQRQPGTAYTWGLNTVLVERTNSASSSDRDKRRETRGDLKYYRWAWPIRRPRGPLFHSSFLSSGEREGLSRIEGSETRTGDTCLSPIISKVFAWIYVNVKAYLKLRCAPDFLIRGLWRYTPMHA